MRINLNNLPSETSLLLQQLAKERYLNRFTLVGGSALSPITYSETIIYTKDIPEYSIADHLLPKEVVSKEQIADYFIEEIKKMKVN